MEFELRVNHQAGVVEVQQFDQLKKQLLQLKDKAQRIVVTKESIKEAKQQRASINKFAEQIDSRRKAVKRDYMQPFVNAEEQLKELYALVKDSMYFIDTQIKALDSQDESNKRAEIVKMWEIRNYRSVSLKLFFNEKWLNKTYSLEKVANDLDEKARQIDEDIRLIENFVPDVVERNYVVMKYKETLDLSGVMSEYKKRIEQKSHFMQDLKAESTSQIINGEQLLPPIFLKITATKNQISALSSFLKEAGIKFEQIKITKED